MAIRSSNTGSQKEEIMDTVRHSKTSQNIKEQIHVTFDDILPMILKPKSRLPEDLEKEAVIKIQVAINRHMNNRNSRLRQRQQQAQDTYM